MRSNPATVSVVVPAFESEAYIREALDSILNQQFPPSEVLVVDDASKDGTAELAEKFHPLVRVIRQPDNRGPGAARNAGVENSRGEYVAFLDADDIWNTCHLATAVDLLERWPEAGAVFSRYELFGSRSGFWPEMLPGMDEPRYCVLDLLRNNFIGMSALVVRRAAVKWRPWFEDLHEFHRGRRVQAEDYGFTLNLALHAPLMACPEATVRYRCHTAQSSAFRVPQILQAFHFRFRTLEKLARDPSRAEMLVTARDRVLLGWEEAIEATWQARDREGLRLMVAWGRKRKLLAHATSLYRLKACLPTFLAR